MCENCVLGPDICSSCAVHSGSPVCCPPADLIKHGCAPLCLCRTDKSLTSTQTRIRSARSWVRSKSPLMSCRPSPSSASPIRRTSRYCSYFSLHQGEPCTHVYSMASLKPRTSVMSPDMLSPPEVLLPLRSPLGFERPATIICLQA